MVADVRRVLDEGCGLLGNRKVPYRLLDVQADAAGKGQMPLQLVFMPGFGYGMGHKKSMKIARAFLIPAQFDICRNAGAGKVCPRRGLHL